MNRFILTILTIFATSFAFSQDTTNWCSSHDILSNQMQSNYRLVETIQDLDGIDFIDYTPLWGELIIPVVVHIVYKDSSENISDEQIQAQLDALTKDFTAENWDITNTPEEFEDIVGDMKIRFKLATVDPNGLPTNGITRTETDHPFFTIFDDVKYYKSGVPPWNTRNYLNIWVCDLTFALGYAQFPNGDILTDGVVVDYTQFGTYDTINGTPMTYRVLTHEVGHWLGLYHIWGDEYCGDDEIKDTPKQNEPHRTCYDSISTCNSSDLTVNYMDYVDPDCMVMFTRDQVNRAWKTLKKYRKEMKSSKNEELAK